MKKLTAKFPFVALGFVNPIASMIVSKILEIAIRETEIGAFFGFIDLRTSMQGKDFEGAAYKYKIASEGRNDEEKRIAEKNVIDAFNKLIKFTS
jgi:hypothetical protein